MIPDALSNLIFEGRKDVKPIKWVGTQRTSFTHRKNPKRLNHVIKKEKENMKKRLEAKDVSTKTVEQKSGLEAL